MFQRKIMNRISIVEKVIYRSLTGQRLGLTIHNNLNSRIHLNWGIETGTYKYKECIERSFVWGKVWQRCCKALKFSCAIDLAVCIFRGIIYEGDNRIQLSIFLEKAIWEKSTVWENYCPKYLSTRNTSQCPVSSSSVIP